MTAGGSNRRIRKTVRPVVWEGAGAQSPSRDPIGDEPMREEARHWGRRGVLRNAA